MPKYNIIYENLFEIVDPEKKALVELLSEGCRIMINYEQRLKDFAQSEMMKWYVGFIYNNEIIVGLFDICYNGLKQYENEAVAFSHIFIKPEYRRQKICTYILTTIPMGFFFSDIVLRLYANDVIANIIDKNPFPVYFKCPNKNKDGSYTYIANTKMTRVNTFNEVEDFFANINLKMDHHNWHIN